MLPWNSIIKINPSTKRPIYLQIVDSIIEEILAGRLQSCQRIPGTRTMSEKLALNRKTVATSYDELLAQGWIEVIPSSGTFIAHKLPIVKHKALDLPNKPANNHFIQSINDLPLSFRSMPNLLEKRIDDGSPDYRLAPIEALIKTARSLVKGRIGKALLLDRDPLGEITLRKTLVNYLSETRAIHGSPDQLLITRGSQMALYLLFNLIVQPGDQVIVTRLNYQVADQMVLCRGGKILRVDTDEEGINVDQVEKLCKSKSIRAMYITPHHHFPTTVTTSAERRMRLLEMSNEYHFAIIEDDYDYDYHYDRTPILPLASLDKSGNVIYIGSFGKMLAPSIRIGYMYGHQRIIRQCATYRRIIDKVGDPIIERAIAELLLENEIQRSIKKAVSAYQTRRDEFVSILKNEFKDYLSFKIPDGGMAIWSNFRTDIIISDLVKKCSQEHLSLDVDTNLDKSSCRLGFASVNALEIRENLSILLKVLRQYY